MFILLGGLLILSSSLLFDIKTSFTCRHGWKGLHTRTGTCTVTQLHVVLKLHMSFYFDQIVVIIEYGLFRIGLDLVTQCPNHNRFITQRKRKQRTHNERDGRCHLGGMVSEMKMVSSQKTCFGPFRVIRRNKRDKNHRSSMKWKTISLFIIHTKSLNHLQKALSAQKKKKAMSKSLRCCFGFSLIARYMHNTVAGNNNVDNLPSVNEDSLYQRNNERTACFLLPQAHPLSAQFNISAVAAVVGRRCWFLALHVGSRHLINGR